MNVESTSPAPDGPRGAMALWRLRVEAWVMVLAVVVAFLGGFLFAGLDEETSGQEQQVPTGFSDTPSQNVTPIAPPLDESQLQSDLPEGHPVVGEGDVAPGQEAPADSPTTVPATTETSAGG